MQLEGFARKLEIAVAAGIVDRETLAAAEELLEAHIRLEERRLFPLIEELVPDDELRSLGLASRDVTCAVRRPPSRASPDLSAAGRRVLPGERVTTGSGASDFGSRPGSCPATPTILVGKSGKTPHQVTLASPTDEQSLVAAIDAALR